MPTDLSPVPTSSSPLSPEVRTEVHGPPAFARQRSIKCGQSVAPLPAQAGPGPFCLVRQEEEYVPMSPFSRRTAAERPVGPLFRFFLMEK
jgi:hypothetical protein